MRVAVIEPAHTKNPARAAGWFYLSCDQSTEWSRDHINSKMKTYCFRLFCLTALFLEVGLITFSSPRSVIAQDNEPVIEQSELDPWEPFNEKMFSFNHDVLDRFVIKPVATAWNAVLPDAVQKGISNVFDNLDVVRRVVNNLLEANFAGAGAEFARFTINSTVGLAGLFDVATDVFGIPESNVDTGITFGVWGFGPGPYLVLPFLPPLNVRDGIGYVFDAAMTPYTYFIPFYASIAGEATNIINERSLSLDTYQQVEESAIDLYAAVRNGYLEKRAAQVRAAKKAP